MSFWTRIRAFGPWLRARLERNLEREIQNYPSSRTSGDRTAFGIALVKKDVREAWEWRGWRNSHAISTSCCARCAAIPHSRLIVALQPEWGCDSRRCRSSLNGAASTNQVDG